MAWPNDKTIARKSQGDEIVDSCTDSGARVLDLATVAGFEGVRWFRSHGNTTIQKSQGA